MASVTLAFLTPLQSSAQVPGTVAAERARLMEITGDSALIGHDRDSSLTSVLPFLRQVNGLQDLPIVAIGPELRLTSNSAIPYTLNDGVLWAGRGWNSSLTGGVAVTQRWRGVQIRAALAPTLVYSQNLPFEVFPSTTPGRSAYANPFHGPEASLDLPHRFGDRHLLRVDPGQSGLELRWPRVEAGATTASEWWGPGIRNAIIMSNNAPGVPRFYVRTARPIHTPAGALSAKLISGALTRSRFFSASEAEHRTLSGVLLELHPAFDSTLTFGFARVVYRPIGPFASPFTMTLARSFDVLFRWEFLDGGPGQKSDQVGSVFARWIFPDAGFEVYGEWARMDLPRTATELLVAAHHTGGWTFGFQWANSKQRHRYLRLRSELTYLEQSRVFSDRPTPDFYSGLASPHGYTQRGQVIGAAIGPGASSQWIAVDWVVPRWQAGGYVARIRWDNDALYRLQFPSYLKHDVSVLAGASAAWRSRFADVSVDLSAAKRYNYLFQNGSIHPGGFRTIDVNNVSLSLTLAPR